MSSTGLIAQSNDNEDAVVKIEQHNHNAFREGEIIVKINAGSAARVSTRGGAVTSGESVIYDLSGKRIETDDITTLPAGIYIRNGRKFIIQ